MVENHPDFAPAFNMHGYMMMRSQNMEAAKKSFERYIALVPNEANPYDSMGDFYAAAGDNAKAIEYYEKAYSMDPENMKVSKEKAEKLKN